MLVFPRRDASNDLCAASDYSNIDLPIGTSGADLANAIDTQAFEGGSTLGAALGGAITAANAHSESEGRLSTIVALTDASPNSDEACGESLSDVATVTKNGFAAGTGPRTNVISVIGPHSVPESHLGLIGAIADAGGGHAAFVNGGQANVATSTRKALEDILSMAELCTLALPGGSPPAALEVSIPGVDSFIAPLVASPNDCQGTGYYVDDTSDAKRAMLCRGEAGAAGFCELVYFLAHNNDVTPATRRCALHD